MRLEMKYNLQEVSIVVGYGRNKMDYKPIFPECGTVPIMPSCICADISG